MLPEIRPSSQVYGEARGPLHGVPVAGALGDQQAALFGQACFDPGEAKCTYGTGAFLLLNTGAAADRRARPAWSPRSATSSAAQPPVYALEGSIAVAGSLVQWLRDNLGLIDTASEMDELAGVGAGQRRRVIVPAFSGLFAPHWRSDARGVIAGLTGYVTKAHLARAALEATAWQVREVVDAMAADSGVALAELKVDGGMTASELLLQIQADVLDVPVVRPEVTETTCLGAAYAAGLAVGFWPDLRRAAGQLAGRPHVAAGDVGRADRDAGYAPLAQGRRPHPRLGLTATSDDCGRRGQRSATAVHGATELPSTVTAEECSGVTDAARRPSRSRSARSRCAARSACSVAPTLLPWIAPTRSSLPVIGRSPTFVTTSPALRPALAAGLPAATACDLRAAVLGVADRDAEVRVADLARP